MEALILIGFVIFFYQLYLKNNRPRNTFYDYEESRQTTQSSPPPVVKKDLPFRADKKMGALSVDTRNNTFKIKGYFIETFGFEDVISYELEEDGQSITSGGMSIGKALVGRALVGGWGGIVGGTTGKRKDKSVVNSMFINLTIRGQYNGRYEIPIITKKTKRNSKDYERAVNQARDIIAMFDIKVDELRHY